jgi:hypothetical protein
MIRNWVTRSISVSTLVLRTVADFQAAIATSMIVAWMLESKRGTSLHQLAHLSSMRTATAGPWTLSGFVLQDTRHYVKKYGPPYRHALLIATLLLTTIVLQFSSTILLSDLRPGPLGGGERDTQVRPGLSYRNMYRRITRDAAWTSDPPFYPTFGEYAEPVSAVNSVADTGMLLRALLPFSIAEDRQKLQVPMGKLSWSTRGYLARRP